MFRIMKYLSKAEIGQMLIALVTIVGQVYFDLKLPDYMSDITTLCLLYTSPSPRDTR